MHARFSGRSLFQAVLNKTKELVKNIHPVVIRDGYCLLCTANRYICSDELLFNYTKYASLISLH